MIRFLTDEDLNGSIFRGIKRRIPTLDIIRVQDAGLRTLRDTVILEFAASENRIVLSHDVNTMESHAAARIRAGRPMAGLFLIQQGLPIGRAVEELEMIVLCSRDDEWNNRIEHLPF